MDIGLSGHGRVPMSETDQFWQYAKEALLSASYAKTDDDKRDLLELARTWTQAALDGRQSSRRSRPLRLNMVNFDQIRLDRGGNADVSCGQGREP